MLEIIQQITSVIVQNQSEYDSTLSIDSICGFVGADVPRIGQEFLRKRSADRWSRARYRRAKDRRSGREEGRKLYHTASLGSLLYVTRIRNEETNDRPNESARMPRFPFHSSFPLPAPYLSFAPRPRHHSFSSSRAVKRTPRSERDRFLPLTRESAVGSREKDFREKFPCICIWRICGASSFFNLFDWNFEKN